MSIHTSVVRLRDQSDVDAIANKKHREAVAGIWTKPKNFKRDVCYVQPNHTFEEAVRRMVDLTGETGAWLVPAVPAEPLGKDLVVVVTQVHESYEATWIMTSPVWANRLYYKE